MDIEELREHKPEIAPVIDRLATLKRRGPHCPRSDK
jgi:hypothetical protein